MSERDAFGNELPRGKAGAGSGEPEASAAFGAPSAPAAPGEDSPTPRPAEGPPPVGGPDRAPVASTGANGSAFEEAPLARAPGTTATAGLSVVPRVAGGCISFVAIVLVVGGCAISGLVGSIGDGVDTFRSISTGFSRTTAVPPPDPALGAPSKSAAPPRGLGRGSLLRRTAFSRAVTKLRGAGLGRPRSLRVAPDRIDTQLVTRTGRLRSVQIVTGGALRTLSTTTSGGFPARDLVSLAAIDRGAPERLARSASGRARLPASRIDYLVLTGAGGTARWLVFFRNGPAYQADRTGRIERSIP